MFPQPMSETCVRNMQHNAKCCDHHYEPDHNAFNLCITVNEKSYRKSCIKIAASYSSQNQNLRGRGCTGIREQRKGFDRGFRDVIVTCYYRDVTK